ncbi:MAG: hypothetical protein AB2810_21645, partial [Candidatus Thiodiazotropha endolucinida]
LTQSLEKEETMSEKTLDARKRTWEKFQSIYRQNCSTEFSSFDYWEHQKTGGELLFYKKVFSSRILKNC